MICSIKLVCYFVRLVSVFAEAGLVATAPDVGVDEDMAQFYFTQLVSGIVRSRSMPTLAGQLKSYLQKFMHGQGVCHRDLKPENLLLNSRGDLKVSDLCVTILIFVFSLTIV